MFNSEKPAPPASKKVVEDLPTRQVTEAEAGEYCFSYLYVYAYMFIQLQRICYNAKIP